MSERLVRTASHWGAFWVQVRDGRAVGVKPFEKDEHPSPLAQSQVEAVYDKSRIDRPHVRKGFLDHGAKSDRTQRGAEPFVPVDWDTALKLVSGELTRVKESFGNRAIFAGSYGWSSAGRLHHAKSLLARFMNLHGGATVQVDTYSNAAGSVITPHVLGDTTAISGPGTTFDTIAENTRLVVSFGGMPLKNLQIDSGGTGEHSSISSISALAGRGIEFVNISPLRTDQTDELKAEWLPAIPGTDTAIMIGLAHTLVAEGLHDPAFLDRYTVGFEKFRRYLMGEDDGQPKDAAWAARISGIDAETIREPRAPHGRNAHLHHHHLVAAARRPRRAADLDDHRARRDARPDRSARRRLRVRLRLDEPDGAGTFAGGGAQPSGRAQPDQFLHPGRAHLRPAAASRHDHRLQRPAHHVPRDQADLLVRRQSVPPPSGHQPAGAGLAACPRPSSCTRSSGRRPRATPTSCCPRPRRSSATTSPRRRTATCSRCIRRSSRSARRATTSTSSPISAERLGFREDFTEGRTEMEWLRHLYEIVRQQAARHGIERPDFETFWETGYIADPVTKHFDYLSGYRADPQGKKLKTPSGRIEIFSEKVASFGYDDCPGHPVWIEPAEWLGSPKADRKLHLISNQPTMRLHGQLDNGPVSRASKVKGREPVLINPQDAAERGITDGDVVRVFNERGACLAGAVVTDAMSRGVLQLQTGAWYDPDQPGQVGTLDRHGNPNVLTLDKGTSKLAQGPSSQTTLVEVERWTEPVPDIRAFDQPAMIRG